VPASVPESVPAPAPVRPMEPGGAPLYVGEGARLVAVNRARTFQR